MLSPWKRFRLRVAMWFARRVMHVPVDVCSEYFGTKRRPVVGRKVAA